MRINLVAAALPALAVPVVGQTAQFPESMDFGPVLATTFEGGGRCGTTDKGLVVRLDGGGAYAFDTELLRVSAVWTDGWLRLRGTAYDGSHGPMPQLRGNKLLEVGSAPGWAHQGSFVDPRPIPHGPLPRAHGQHRGHELVGDQVVIAYRIGDMDVREVAQLEASTPPRFVRILEVGPSAVEQVLVLAEAEGSAADVAADRRSATLEVLPARSERVELDGTTTAWSSLAVGEPSQQDHADARHGKATMRWVEGFAPPHGSRAPELPKLHDGQAARTDDDTDRSVWFDEHELDGRRSDDGRIHVDLGAAVDVTRVSTFSWHEGGRAVQRYDLYASAEARPTDAVDPESVGWTRLASVDTASLGHGDKHAASVAAAEGLGRFRHLLLHVQSGGTFWSEIDVFTAEHPAPIDTGERPRRHVLAQLRGPAGPELDGVDERLVVRIPPHERGLRFAVALANVVGEQLAVAQATPATTAPVPLVPHGNARRRWGEPLALRGRRGGDDGAFAVDTIPIPFDNPFGSRMRTAAFDFFRDGRAAVSTWNGDVWIVSGLDDELANVTWQRFATGLFDPLGLRIVDDVVHVHGRDGLTRLVDANGDGEADRHECFNNQVYITPAFHEFAFDLQTDTAGNFYFSKGAPVNPGGRGFMTIVPHHGTILKVDARGESIEVVASGLRAPNGIGVSPEGVITSGDNEGTYMPRCRLNWIERPGFYAGVRDTAHRADVPAEPDLPLCWFPMEVDNSSGGQVWVTGDGWPDLQGRLLHLSYGTCSTFLVLGERVDGRMQGGVVRLPAEFSSSCMRGRFSPVDGQLYVIGLQGWQTSAAREGGFHRVRRTAAPLGLPTALRTCRRGVYLTFAEPLDAETAADAESYGVEVWNYRYSSNYGSPEVSVLEPGRKVASGKPNRDALRVAAAKLSPDGRTVLLEIDGMQPVHQMRITWNVDAADGRLLRGELHNTIHALVDDPGFPAER